MNEKRKYPRDIFYENKKILTIKDKKEEDGQIAYYEFALMQYEETLSKCLKDLDIVKSAVAFRKSVLEELRGTTTNGWTHLKEKEPEECIPVLLIEKWDDDTWGKIEMAECTRSDTYDWSIEGCQHKIRDDKKENYYWKSLESVRKPY